LIIGNNQDMAHGSQLKLSFGGVEPSSVEPTLRVVGGRTTDVDSTDTSSANLVDLNVGGRVGDVLGVPNDDVVGEITPEQKWFGEFKVRFDAFAILHPGVQWVDVEKSLKADPEAMKKLRALDEKGHNMNVFGEENGGFVFVSGWSDYREVSLDHRNIVFDDAIGLAGVDLADQKFHEQLRKVVDLNGWAWLNTDTTMRKSGEAFVGLRNGIGRCQLDYRTSSGSFRAMLKVKKV